MTSSFIAIVVFLLFIGSTLLNVALAIIYKVHKRRYIWLAVISIICAITIPGLVEEHLLFNKDARNILTGEGVELKHDFQILSHNVVGGDDINALFELKINQFDKARLSKMILTSPHFKDSSVLYKLDDCFLKVSDKVYYDDTNEANYYRKSYQKNKGYVRNRIFISISKIGDTLWCQY